MEFIEAWSADEGAQRVAEGFKKTFGTEPAGVWQAPGRVNIIGEHTDYNQGLCAPIALPHRTYVAVSPEPEADVVRLASAQAPGVWEIAMNEVVPGKVKGWGAYVAGTVWGMRGLGLEAPGITGYVDSCVPFGAGLSSSAALSCSFAVALEDLSREAGDITCTTDVRKQLVKAAMAAENQIVVHLPAASTSRPRCWPSKITSSSSISSISLLTRCRSISRPRVWSCSSLIPAQSTS